MFCSLSRITVATVLVLALALSAVPAQAQPRDHGSRVSAPDASWLEAALGWVQDFLGDDTGSQSPQGRSIGANGGHRGLGHAVPMTSSCVDPQGNPVVPCLDNQ